MNARPVSTLSLSSIILIVATAIAPVQAAAITVSVRTAEDVAHGGGCRKSSPPGQCCHMDRKAGTVHCH